MTDASELDRLREELARLEARNRSLAAALEASSEVGNLEAAKRELERFRSIAEITPDFVGMCTPDGRTLYLNRSARALCGIAAETDVVDEPISRYHPEDLHAFLFETALRLAIEHGVWQGESKLLGADGEQIPVSQVLIAHDDDDGELEYISTVMRDLRPIRELEARLRQSQRLESIGRLAGGVAHDFNNMLLVVENYIRFVQETIPSDDPGHADLGVALEATARATGLCSQLLGFARQQVIRPRIVDLNEIVASFARLADRLTEEDVTLEVVADPKLSRVRIDPAQFDQVLANLVVNASDAMPNGGRVTIETANVIFDPEYARLHPGVTPGDYVMISVSDTGEGIAREHQPHVFEPFFTTKAPGHGTGLGLATVHGAVMQNDGHIWLSSEPDQGTCLKIFLPRVEGDLDSVETNVGIGTLDGSETVLVVEDEPMVRSLTVRALASAGYQVLEADAPGDALELAEGHAGPIELCVTDVIMPEMSGKQFAEALARRRPETAVLYVSGYTEDTIVHRGVLESGVAFLAKPFSVRELLARVREQLDGSD